MNDQYFDKNLCSDLRQAFKDCDMDYDTYCGWSVPPVVIDRMKAQALESEQAQIRAGLIPGYNFK